MPPKYTYLGPIFDSAKLHYNPCNDLIFPSLVSVGKYLKDPLARYYLYYAPHDAPGGVCLATSDQIEGPWKEYEGNPIITKDWAPHYHVSHVSSPHALFIPEEGKFFLYYHGENDTTRLATSRDGIHFDYQGEPVTTAMYDEISESSYARVFRCQQGPRTGQFVMLFMGNNRGTRRIYAAWSKDGRKFEAQRRPLISPPPHTEVTQVGAPWYYPFEGRNQIVFHGDKTGSDLKNLTSDLYLADVGEDFSGETHLGKFYAREEVGPDNARVADPCLVEEEGRQWLFFSTGPRLGQQIALARGIE